MEWSQVKCLPSWCFWEVPAGTDTQMTTTHDYTSLCPIDVLYAQWLHPWPGRGAWLRVFKASFLHIARMVDDAWCWECPVMVVLSEATQGMYFKSVCSAEHFYQREDGFVWWLFNFFYVYFFLFIIFLCLLCLCCFVETGSLSIALVAWTSLYRLDWSRIQVIDLHLLLPSGCQN